MSIQHRPLNGTYRFPAEVMEQILSNVKDVGTRTLHACCLVCVGWHSYLIDSLYEPIRLHSKPQIYKLSRASRIYPAVRRRLALASSVMLEGNWSKPGLVDAFPLVLGPHLHKVQDLTLHDCFEQPLHPSFFVMLPQLKDVKHLVLSGSPPQNLVDFQCIVRAFPQLEELDIAGLRGPSWDALQLTPLHVLNLPCMSKLACIRAGYIMPQFFRDLVAWLSSSGVCSTIRRLDMSLSSRLHGRAHSGPLRALLACTASTLEHLRMYIPIKILGGCWGLPDFLHLRVLYITLNYWVTPMSTKDVQRVFRSVFAALTSPVLESVHLELCCIDSIELSPLDMDSRDTTTDTDRAQFIDLHIALARPIFSSLRHVTLVLFTPWREELMSAKDVALEHLDFMRALFAPWCVRGAANLACAISTTHKSWEVVVDKGEGSRYIDLRGRRYKLDTALRVAGLDP